MERVFSNHIDELNTEESYFRKVILRNNNLIIPYINLAVSNHPLNERDKPKYINYSYLVAIDLSYLSGWVKNEYDYNGKHYVVINQSENEKLYTLGGENLDEESLFSEIRLACKMIFLQVLNISELSDHMWIPIDTPNFKKNMNSGFTEDFFNGLYMPSNIKNLII